MSDIFDEIFMEIPAQLKISERQRKAIDKLDLSNRRSVIKALMAQQGISDRDNYKNSVANSRKASNDLSLNDFVSIAIDTLKYTPEALGEMVADGVIASEHLQNMKDTNKKLINKYGKNTNAADGTDNYYHALLQCQLAKISPESKNYGLRAGYLKEVYDYHKKKKYMPKDVLIKDMRKDLQNNFHGSNLGEKYRNSNKPCYELLDDYRSKNMKNENIK